jgi:hypothetical protein
MAANPNLPPDERRLREDHTHVVLTRKRTNPWPIILAIVAAAILIALIAWVVVSRAGKTSSLPRGVHVAQQVSTSSAMDVGRRTPTFEI